MSAEIAVLPIAERFNRTSFSVWELQAENSVAKHRPEVRGKNSDEIAASFAAPAYHKCIIFVCATDSVKRRSILTQYAIRRGAWLGRYDDHGCKIYAHSAKRICSFEVDAFEPSKPWQWTPGCDAIGRDDVIDVRAWDPLNQNNSTDGDAA